MVGVVGIVAAADADTRVSGRGGVWCLLSSEAG